MVRNEGLDAVFARLRSVLRDAAPDLIVTRDAPGALELRRATIDPRTGEPAWFGALTTRARYVAVHLLPLYERPALGEGLSPALAKRRQGKSCFNFRIIDEPLFAELATLIQACAATTTPIGNDRPTDAPRRACEHGDHALC